MGQRASSECNCNDGFFTLCTPEDPNKEAQATLQTEVPGYPGYPQPTLSDRGPTPVGSMDAPSPGRQQGAGGFTFTPEEAAFVGAPPPEDSWGGVPPPDPVREPAGRVQPPQTSSAAAARRSVTADDILSNLEGAEEVVYGETFAVFLGGPNGYVALDNAAMRDFICTNSAISMDDLDLELLKVASPDEGISRDGYLHLLREFAIGDGDAISHFMGLSSDGESLAAEECRSGLLLFATQKLSTNFSDERWERIFNTVMWDAGVTVSMEQWLGYCKFTGRIIRLLRCAQV